MHEKLRAFVQIRFFIYCVVDEKRCRELDLQESHKEFSDISLCDPGTSNLCTVVDAVFLKSTV